MSETQLLTGLYNKITQIAQPRNILEVGECQAMWEENGGLGACHQKNFLGPRPLERRKTPFWNIGECCCHHLSLFSERKLTPNLETKCKYATLTRHFSVLCLKSNAGSGTSRKCAVGKMVQVKMCTGVYACYSLMLKAAFEDCSAR